MCHFLFPLWFAWSVGLHLSHTRYGVVTWSKGREKEDFALWMESVWSRSLKLSKGKKKNSIFSLSDVTLTVLTQHLSRDKRALILQKEKQVRMNPSVAFSIHYYYYPLLSVCISLSLQYLQHMQVHVMMWDWMLALKQMTQFRVCCLSLMRSTHYRWHHVGSAWAFW